jgi:hypothetical protein
MPEQIYDIPEDRDRAGYFRAQMELNFANGDTSLLQNPNPVQYRIQVLIQ